MLPPGDRLAPAGAGRLPGGRRCASTPTPARWTASWWASTGRHPARGRHRRAAGPQRRRPARTRHQVIAEGRVFFGYLDPHTARTPGIHVGHPSERDLIHHLRADAEPDPAHLFDRLGARGPVRMDERIGAALRFMRTAEQVSAAEVAREVHLSTSRFLHLFSAHTGTSFRRYRLWTRMMRVAAAVSAGHDLTRAATEAGFASPAHFSDSFRAIFGLTAGRLLAAGTRIVVTG